MDRIDEFLKSLLDKTKEERDLLREKEHICPSEETAACYLDKLLKDTEKEDFEEHLAECGDCLQQIILLYDIKKEVEQSGYMEAPAELTQQAKNLVQEEIIQEEPVPAGSMAPESSEKSLANVIFEFFGKAIRARKGYRLSYGWRFNKFNEKKVVMRRTKVEIGKLVKKEAVSNMLMVMLSDGKVTPEEMKWFEVACGKLGFTLEETKALYDRALNNSGSLFDFKKFTPAKDVHERVNRLIPVILMMMSDGVIDDRELEFCRLYAAALGFEPDTVSDIIEVVTEGIKQDHDKNTISAEIEEFLRK